jgi:hypothetical protein
MDAFATSTGLDGAMRSRIAAVRSGSPGYREGVERLAGHPLARRGGGRRPAEPLHHGLERRIRERRAVDPRVGQDRGPQVHVRVHQAGQRDPVAEFEYLGSRTAQPVEFGPRSEREHPAASHRHGRRRRPLRIHRQHGPEDEQIRRTGGQDFACHRSSPVAVCRPKFPSVP